MNGQNQSRRAKGAPGIKALIAAASVAASIAGWAILPGNDPASVTAASDRPAGQITTDGQSLPPWTSGSAQSQAPDVQVAPTQIPVFTQPNAPLSTVPQGRSRRGLPITGTHSSR